MMTPNKRFRCRFCGHALNAWLPVAQEPDGAMLLQHLGQHHLTEVEAYIDPMHTDEHIAHVVMEVFAVVEEPA